MNSTNRYIVVTCLLLGIGFVPRAHAAPNQPCERLAQLALPNTQITSAQTVAAGAFPPPSGGAAWMAASADFYRQLPAFCRVTAVAKPTMDSDIRIEVWMPAAGWNGKFRGKRQRWIRGRNGLSRARSGNPSRLRIRSHGHRPCGRQWRRPVGARTRGENRGFRLSGNSPDDLGRQRDGHSILRRNPETILFFRLFEWRAPGVDGSAAFSRRLRRRPGGRSGKLLDTPVVQRAVGRAGQRAGPSQLYSQQQSSRDCRRRTGSVRHRRRSERWHLE